jgi:hypothetical protein
LAFGRSPERFVHSGLPSRSGRLESINDVPIEPERYRHLNWPLLRTALAAGFRPDPGLIDEQNPEWTEADFARAGPAREVLSSALYNARLGISLFLLSTRTRDGNYADTFL